MSEKHKWWHQVDAIDVQHGGFKKKTYELMGRHEEQVLINRRDVMEKKDAWDVQEFITQMYIKQLLRHPAFQLLLAFLLVTNAITIALRTNSYLGQYGSPESKKMEAMVQYMSVIPALLWRHGKWGQQNSPETQVS
uniref:Cation channel, sperm associated 4 n=1 Tax=Rattus norvegicus TaxID=10116 RepID=A0A8I6A7K5_RAT